ncbi:helix-turn-helix transcriptional regulator [Hyphomonas pacifica]|nr:WYL domain-containing protein [Hyphomonas pacifica]KCZ52268.1 transcriptional regulator [Hyphomonas pacifica]
MNKSELRWGVERRLEFIEFRLYWEGHVNRGDVMEVFGVSVNQASTDLNRYLELAPGNMLYDKSERTYVRGDHFAPKFLQPDAGRYLSQLHLLDQGIVERSDAWLGSLPEFEASPTPARGVEAPILRSVLRAIENREAIEVRYQSMSQPEPAWRWIAPHALGFDGFRWHARAWCFKDAAFKDFVLSRILKDRARKPSEIDPQTDRNWHKTVDLVIAPHPDLSDAQKAAVALDYGMTDGHATLTVRNAMLYYSLRRLGLDTDPSVREPKDQQIVLKNRLDTAGFATTNLT